MRECACIQLYFPGRFCFLTLRAHKICRSVLFHPFPTSTEDIPRMNVSYKPQKISPKFQGTVRQLLHTKIRDTYIHPQFVSDVMKPLHMEAIIDQEVLNLSGGELQRVALTLCLGQVSPLCDSSTLQYISLVVQFPIIIIQLRFSLT